MRGNYSDTYKIYWFLTKSWIEYEIFWHYQLPAFVTRPGADQIIIPTFSKKGFSFPSNWFIYGLCWLLQAVFMRFIRQIRQSDRIGGWDGVKAILKMPGFWERLDSANVNPWE